MAIDYMKSNDNLFLGLKSKNFIYQIKFYKISNIQVKYSKGLLFGGGHKEIFIHFDHGT